MFLLVFQLTTAIGFSFYLAYYSECIDVNLCKCCACYAERRLCWWKVSISTCVVHRYCVIVDICFFRWPRCRWDMEMLQFFTASSHQWINQSVCVVDSYDNILKALMHDGLCYQQLSVKFSWPLPCPTLFAVKTILCYTSMLDVITKWLYLAVFRKTGRQECPLCLHEYLFAMREVLTLMAYFNSLTSDCASYLWQKSQSPECNGEYKGSDLYKTSTVCQAISHMWPMNPVVLRHLRIETFHDIQS